MSEKNDGKVAIVGMGCRFPGGVESPAGYWRLLQGGLDAIGPMPPGRFDVEKFVHPVPGTPGKLVTAEGGFLNDIDRFDAGFFGLSPREARKIDPQHRLLLEVAWEALEDAGIPPSSLAGRRVGVFVGVWSGEYENVMYRVPSDLDFHSITGGGRYAASGRISYALDLRGPALTVDTGCSAALVALHLGRQAILNGEADLAIVGAANLVLQPHVNIGYSRSGMLSAGARCRFGDADAEGYVRSDGAAAVVLKPLADALAQRDPVRGVLLATAVNADGRGSGQLATPSADAQAELLESVYARAGVDPASVPYVEAHGTGTRVGDPVELQALGRVLGGSTRKRPLIVGSAKTIIGHTEAAAGMAGLLKTVLALEHRRIPANLHFRSPNEAIAFADLQVEIPTEPRSWPEDAPLVAGVSSFGITGTNAHAVVAAAPFVGARQAVPVAGPRAVLLSGQTKPALKQAAQRLKAQVEELCDSPASSSESAQVLADLAYSTSCRRDHHAQRLVVVAESLHDVVSGIDEFLGGESSARIVEGAADVAQGPAVAFVFSGQGSQWLGMGRELMQRAPAFAAAIERCDLLVQQLAGWSVRKVLDGAAGAALEHVDVVQPTLTCVQIALAEQLRAWGVQPRAVVGHSMGEVAAAHVAGALSLEDALRVVTVRSRLLSEIAGQGAMALIDMEESEVAALIAPVGDRVSVAAVNGPRSTVISGDPATIDVLLERLADQAVFARRVKVDVASHSAQTDVLLPRLQDQLDTLQPTLPGVAFYSTARPGAPRDALLDARYWMDNLRRPVRLAAAVAAMIEDGIDTFVEIAPHPVLLSSLADLAAGGSVPARALAGPRRDEPEEKRLLELVARLHTIGVPVAWERLARPDARAIRLPSYPWQRERHWIEHWEDWSGDAAPAYGHTVQPPENSQDIAYVVEWQPHVCAPAASGPGQSWLLVADSGGVAAELSALIQAAGEHVRIVPNSAELTREVAARGGRLTGFIDLRALDGGGQSNSGDFLNGLKQGFESVMGGVQALLRSGARTARGTWLVTAGVHGPGARTPRIDCAAQSTVWGFGRTSGAEHPELNIGMIDLDPGDDAASSAQLVWTAVNDARGESQFAFAQGSAYVARMVRAPTLQSSHVSWRADSTYLITGGLGDVGLLVAEDIVRRGARRLILSGRTRLPAREHWSTIASEDPLFARLAAVRRLEHMGASVHLASFDVGDERQLRSFLDRFRSEGWPAIRGVIHCAGSLETAAQGEAAFHSIVAGKALGAYNLHLQLSELDHFILFSSIASVLPQSMGYYAAANAVLDALAVARHAAGLPGLSISWGVWADTGMARDAQVSRYVRILESRGIVGFPRDEATALFAWAAGTSRPHLILTNVDWQKASLAFANRGAAGFYAELVNGKGADTDTARLALLALPESQRRGALNDFVCTAVSQVLQLPRSAISASLPFGRQGLDSLMAIEFRNRLELELGLRLPASLAWNYPTVGALTDHLLAQVAAPAGVASLAQDSATAAAASEERIPVIAVLEALEQQSEEDVLRQLRGEAV